MGIRRGNGAGGIRIASVGKKNDGEVGTENARDLQKLEIAGVRQCCWLNA